MSTAAIQKMTVKEAAAELRISPALVYSLCAVGKIRHERHGLGRGTIRISPKALEEYRKASEVSPPVSVPASSGSPAEPFSVLDPKRLGKAWKPR